MQLIAYYQARPRVKLNQVKILLIMKLTTCFMLLTCLQVSAKGVAQKVTLNENKSNLEKVLKKIEQQTGYTFLYENNVMKNASLVTLHVKEASVDQALTLCFNGQPLTYKIFEHTVVIKEKVVEQNLKKVEAIAPSANNISGEIVNSKGEPLVGVSVTVKGTNVGTSSNATGFYSIDVPGGGTLIFSYVGFTTKEVLVNNRSKINVVMEESVSSLDQVVVVGYGTQKKVNLTGSVDAIRGDELAERPVSNLSQALQGVSPGTTITNNGGAPGTDGATVRIRGLGTFGNNNPLILLDGVTVSNMDNIDPQDIENISILKDAASSAIYGSRAANGVILITTKRGKNKPLSVAYSAYAGLKSLTRTPKWVATSDYMKLINEAAVNAHKEPKYTEEAIQKTIAGNDPYKYPNTDWWSLLFQNALQQKHTVSLSGGSEKVRTAVSFFYLDNQGVMINTSAKQFGLRVNNDVILNKNLDFSLDLSLNKRHRTAPGRIDDVYWNLLHDVPPTIVAKYPDGSYQLGPTNRNPLAAAEMSGYDKQDNYQGIISSSLTWKPAQGLEFSGRISIKEDFNDRKRYRNEYVFKDYETKATLLTWRNALDQWAPKEDYSSIQITSHYDKVVGDHSFQALLGYSQEQDFWRDLGGSRTDFYSNNLQELNVGSDVGKNNLGNSTEWALRSAFGRLNYSFLNRYLFEANFRYDGSSRFAEGRRWGFFPSFSAGYRISQENFWQPLKSAINEFKLRASWGQLGNQDIALYQYIQTISLGQNYSFGGQLAPGAAQTALANQFISWESSTNNNLGVDIGLLNNKLTITADFFDRITSDILLIRDIPRTAGLQAPTQNVGSVKNTGWELALNYNNKISKDFKYTLGFNISDVKNKILKYGEASVSGWKITKEGESMGALYGYRTEGLFQTEEQVKNHAFQNTLTAPGDIIYKDMNNDNIINDLDKVVLGSTIPRYTFGISLGGKYKNWDVSLFFNGVGKSNGFQEGALIEGPIWDGFTTKEMLDRWTPENPNATWPRLVYQTIHNEQPSDWWIQKTSFFRLKNFQLGYSLSSGLLNRIHIKSVRAYLSGENVFTLTKARNLDPEFPSGRATYYPQTKIYAIGLNVNF